MDGNISKDSYVFEEEGVIVWIPENPDQINVVKSVLDMPHNDFVNPRPVIRIDFIKGGKPINLSDIPKPFYIYVFYTYDEISRAHEAKKDLFLAIHDEEKWTPFERENWDYKLDDDERDFLFPNVKPDWIGFAKIRIESWQDPAIAWGP
jgi:hypothetical protein